MSRILTKKPKLILVMGTPGVGKTTLSKKILERLFAVYIDNNFVADAFDKNSRHRYAYTETRPIIYNIIYTLTEKNLLLGNSVLLDIPHVKHSQDAVWAQFIFELVSRAKCDLKVIKCYCSEKTLFERMKYRGEPRDDWKLMNWGEHMQREPIHFSIPFSFISLDTENQIEENILSALSFILDSVDDIA